MHFKHAPILFWNPFPSMNICNVAISGAWNPQAARARADGRSFLIHSLLLKRIFYVKLSLSDTFTFPKRIFYVKLLLSDMVTFPKKNIFYVIHSLSETFTFPKRNLSFASFLFDTYCIAAKIQLWQFLPTKNYTTKLTGA